MAGWDKRLALAMREAGWRYDAASDGYRKGRDQWVSRGQAEEAFHAAERGDEVELAARSETVARAVVEGTVDGKA